MNIYVGNLPYKYSENELRETFAAFGRVSRVKIVLDRETGRSKGFAFVEMENKADGEAAVKNLHGTEIMGRTLTVNEARPRPVKRPQRRAPA
ncbi:RNA-binding protein [Catenovulum agarivorans DS-2]|uniref:RNA-binding protein n=1 Tax=Catenovulum agarivorans DS-2 TaxID=1328313 RepID=W7QU10_9ALTE|nr:RNA-binding protein [Catenovulum agarivorans]EWH11328.1 RNA-binding protein [Catenovulum agarivorans DS-2]